MNAPHYIGFDIHKKTISYCVRSAAGEIVEEGVVPARRAELRRWASERSQPLAGSDGSDLVQRLDLRHAEALRRAVRRWRIPPR